MITERFGEPNLMVMHGRLAAPAWRPAPMPLILPAVDGWVVAWREGDPGSDIRIVLVALDGTHSAALLAGHGRLEGGVTHGQLAHLVTVEAGGALTDVGVRLVYVPSPEPIILFCTHLDALSAAREVLLGGVVDVRFDSEAMRRASTE